MASYSWKGYIPKTHFALDVDIPLYSIKDGTSSFNKRLIDYVLECEKIVNNEELVSSVTKSDKDPYPYTQHWKQHNLLDDSLPRLNGDHLVRFKKDPIQQELFNKIRENYLLFLAETKKPRTKVWIHGWANVLREGQFISHHCHVANEHSYLAGVYYPHNADTVLHLIHPYVNKLTYDVKTEESRLIFFPSWMNHVSTETKKLRISVAVDIVVETTVEKNPWRPHLLFDDPNTMKGL